MDICDMTFCDLKYKDVVNICDGKRLGRIIDIVIDIKTGKVKGLVLPGTRGFNIFKQPEDIFIPWKNILRIGEDVILIEIFMGRGKKCSEKNSGKDDCRECEDDCEKDDCRHFEENSKETGFYDETIKPRVLKYLYSETKYKKKVV